MSCNALLTWAMQVRLVMRRMTLVMRKMTDWKMVWGCTLEWLICAGISICVGFLTFPLTWICSHSSPTDIWSTSAQHGTSLVSRLCYLSVIPGSIYPLSCNGHLVEAQYGSGPEGLNKFLVTEKNGRRRLNARHQGFTLEAPQWYERL